MTGRDHARIALATIRLVNGTMALLAPGMMLRRLGADPDANKVACYPLRMFGIRTVVLGLDLLAGGSMQEKGRVGVVIHATDAASAINAGLRRQLPVRVAMLAAGISVTNTVLAAIIARPDRTCGPATERARLDGSPVLITASSGRAARARARYRR
jgi:hypothetical protein